MRLATDWAFAERPPVTSLAELRRAVASRRFDRGIAHAVLAFVEQPERSLRAIARDHGVDAGGLCRAVRSIPGASALREARKHERPEAMPRAARRQQFPGPRETRGG